MGVLLPMSTYVNQRGVGGKKETIFGIRYRQIFSGGVSDQNEKLVGKFFAHLRRAKKEFPNFSPAPGFFSL